VAGFAKKYLSDDLFAHLQAFGVSYDIDGEVDVAEESHQIEATAAEYEAADMALQASDLREQYRKFAGARRVFHLMHQQGILHIDTVIPIRYLPEFTVACPVWYAEGRDGDVKNQLHEDDPRVSPFVTYLCDQVGSKEFAWFFQLYNRRTRLLSSFQSNRDIMPPKLVKLLGVARQVFDYTAIATPYHGEASRDWQDAKWLRQIDPFLLGFNRDVPFIFILGRWSGTGIFPLFLDMIADTMAHLESHKQLLHNFSVNTYWYRGGNGNSDLLSMGGGQPHPLEPFADQVLAAYREGRLFQFLRGEKPELTAAEK
jgi:hypothetical protein